MAKPTPILAAFGRKGKARILYMQAEQSPLSARVGGASWAKPALCCVLPIERLGARQTKPIANLAALLTCLRLYFGLSTPPARSALDLVGSETKGIASLSRRYTYGERDVYLWC